ncbi:MAG TPA: DegV family protein [Anaerolineae bacterium]
MTRVIADTTCGLPFALTGELGIPMIPQIINLGDESYREGIEIDFARFMAWLCEQLQPPKTAAPYVNDFVDVFTEYAGRGESLVCIHPSADVSGTVRSAEVAKAAFPEADIRVIDTRTIAGPLGMIVLAADRLAKSGASAGEVELLVREMMPRARIYFLVDTLEFLRRGGRIGGAAALVGSLLQIKPILTFRDGRVDQFEKERTKRRALARLKEIVVTDAAPGPDAHLTVMHTGGESEQEAAGVAAELQAAVGADKVMLMELAPAIVTHAGPGALAIGFFTPGSMEGKA